MTTSEANPIMDMNVRDGTQSEEEIEKLLSPQSLAHVVLRTANYQTMVDFYKTFLGAHAAFETPGAAFLAYDDQHHRVGITAFNNFEKPKHPASSIEHIAFIFVNLNYLATAYEQRNARGTRPTWCLNYRPTTSMSYSDPDGNRSGTQVENVETMDEAIPYIKSAAFQQNPIGTDFDPEEFVRRVRSWEGEDSIQAQPNDGPHNLPTEVPTGI
ncbi:hypothetical protein N7G274_000588 [Stereocaulon virgatum]|uniref:VOC domain-containing protein n=1 Tax=Stereocaulon virgatum TaxID=373712 RepID=A0ABR4AVC0_9LECA